MSKKIIIDKRKCIACGLCTASPYIEELSDGKAQPKGTGILPFNQEAAFKEIIEIINTKEYDLLILDEMIATINNGFIELNDVIEFLKNKPEGLEVVMTGRDPNPELIELANYVTEMKCIKHPFEEGIPSRIGIEM